MAKYIDSGAFQAALVRKQCGPANKRYTEGWNDCLMRVKSMVSAAPIIDAVPVVRCKDCKHKGWVQEPCHGKSVDYCKVWDCTLRNLETTFCSYGERKDGSVDHDA